jgi:hypothetical protein
MRIVALIATLSLFATASLAVADTVTRDSYTATVEPICKKNTKINQRILKPVRKLVKTNKLKPAAKRVAHASRALKGTWRQLKQVPQPAGDEATLGRWLNYVKKEADLFMGLSKKLKAGKKSAAFRQQILLKHNADVANNTVSSFDFVQCRFDPSKFGL